VLLKIHLVALLIGGLGWLDDRVLSDVAPELLLDLLPELLRLRCLVAKFDVD